MNLPQFPTFKKLSLEDKDVVTAFVKSFPSYGEFSFTCMFVWDIVDPVFISELNGNLVVKFVDFRARKYYYTLLGDKQIAESTHAVIDLSVKEGLDATLYTVPKTVAHALKDHEDFEVVEDVDNHDYVISVNTLAMTNNALPGVKKNKIKRFETEYGRRTSYCPIDLKDPKNIQEMRGMLERWSSSTPRDSIDIITELSALEKSFKYAAELPIQAFGSYIDGQLEAFSIFEQTDKKSVILHFDKANKEYVGIFEHLKHNLAKHLAAMDIELINYGQDLGVEGLRNAKLSYEPVGYLKKYTVHSRVKPGQHQEAVRTHTA